jgi:hypothetical protein
LSLPVADYVEINDHRARPNMAGHLHWLSEYLFHKSNTDTEDFAINVRHNDKEKKMIHGR